VAALRVEVGRVPLVLDELAARLLEQPASGDGWRRVALHEVGQLFTAFRTCPRSFSYDGGNRMKSLGPSFQYESPTRNAA
jgi:hypothetical protein